MPKSKNLWGREVMRRADLQKSGGLYASLASPFDTCLLYIHKFFVKAQVAASIQRRKLLISWFFYHL